MNDTHRFFGIKKETGSPVWICMITKGRMYTSEDKESCPHCDTYSKPKQRRKRRTPKTEVKDE